MIAGLFHAGVLYFIVSLLFLGLTAWGLKVLLDIKEELKSINWEVSHSGDFA